MGGRTLTETLGAHLLVARATLLTAAGSRPHTTQAGLGAVWSRERHEGKLPEGRGERCSRRDLGWRGWGTWGGSSWWGQASGSPSHPPHSCPQKTGADTHPGTRRSPPCSHKTGRLHSWLAPCRIHQCLRRGRQDGDCNPHFTHREAEAWFRPGWERTCPGSKSVAETAGCPPPQTQACSWTRAGQLETTGFQLSG